MPLLVNGWKPATAAERAFAASMLGERIFDGACFIRASRAARLLRMNNLCEFYGFACKQRWETRQAYGADEKGHERLLTFYKKVDVLATAEKRKQMRK